MLPQIGMLADPITKCSMRETHDKYGVKEYVNTALQEVKENAFTVKLPDGTIQDLEFDYGFNCLGMRSNNPVLPEIQEAFADTNTYVYTIGDPYVHAVSWKVPWKARYPERTGIPGIPASGAA